MRGWPARFTAVNRGKRRLAVDLKAPAGRDALLRVIDRADAVIEGFRPGVMARLGLGWDVLHARRPALVLLSLSGFGQTGPLAARAGHDLTYQALAGSLALAAGADGVPVVPGTQTADLGGALWGLAGLLGAMLAAARTGQGRWLDLSMTEAAASLIGHELAAAWAGEPSGRGTSPLLGGAASYGVYACQDGRHLAVAALEPRFWRAFSQALGLDPAERDQGRLRGQIAARLAEQPRDAWLRILEPLDCCVEPVLEPDELRSHAQHVARGVFAGGQVRGPFAPTAPAGADADQSETILREAGLADAEVEALRAQGVLAR
jgi:alpha-methylacyl-CoA racemase